MWLIKLFFSTILQTWYVELRISRNISESPLEFEITGVDCSKIGTLYNEPAAVSHELNSPPLAGFRPGTS